MKRSLSLSRIIFVDFEWKPKLKMALIYLVHVLTEQCVKNVFSISDDFVPNGSGLLKMEQP